MKINGKEINLFDEQEENQELLRDHAHVAKLLGHSTQKKSEMTLFKFANIYFEIKQQIISGKIKMPHHDRSFCRVLFEKYKIEVTENEMMELRDYYENYFDEAIRERISSDVAAGMSAINLKQMGME